MKKYICCLLFLFATQFSGISVRAQGLSQPFPVVIEFGSECCGVPPDDSLRAFIMDFKSREKIKTISATRIGPMGREGEYWLAFSLIGLNKKQRSLFMQQLKPIVVKLKGPGYATYAENRKIDKHALPARASLEKVAF